MCPDKFNFELTEFEYEACQVVLRVVLSAVRVDLITIKLLLLFRGNELGPLTYRYGLRAICVGILHNFLATLVLVVTCYHVPRAIVMCIIYCIITYAVPLL